MLGARERPVSSFTFVLREFLEVVPRPVGEDVPLLDKALLHGLPAVDDDDESRAHVQAVHVTVLLPPPANITAKPYNAIIVWHFIKVLTIYLFRSLSLTDDGLTRLLLTPGMQIKGAG